jgi:hypothetical protein
LLQWRLSLKPFGLGKTAFDAGCKADETAGFSCATAEKILTSKLWLISLETSVKRIAEKIL